MKILALLTLSILTVPVYGNDYLSALTPTLSSIGPCNKPFEIAPTASIMFKNTQDISKIYSCDSDHFKSNSLSKDSCAMAIACKNSIIDKTDDSSQGIDFILNEFLAKDNFQDSFERKYRQMESFEVLKAFAQEKYKKTMGKDCSDKFDPTMKTIGTCNLDLLDESFKEYQSKCSMKSACLNNDETEGALGFKSYKDKFKSPKVSMTIDYLKYRVGTKKDIVLKRDNEFVEKLSDYVNSDEFKKAKGAKRNELFSAFIDKNSLIIDPVLSYELTNAKSTNDYVNASKTLTNLLAKISNKKAFVKDYNSFRENRTKEILDSKNPMCASGDSIRRMCGQMTALSKGQSLRNKSLTKFLSLEKVNVAKLKSKDLYENLKNRLGENFDDRKIETILNASKCLAYNLPSQDDKTYGISSPDSDNYRPAYVDHDDIDSSISIFSRNALQILPNVSWEKGSEEDSTVIGRSEVEATSSSEKSAIASHHDRLDDIAPGTPVSVAPTHEIPPNEISGAYNNSYLPESYNPMRVTEESAQKDKTEAKEATTSSSSSVSKGNGDIGDLKKRLAASEAQIEQMKINAKEAEDKRAEEERIAKEEALIKDLKGQIAELKAKKDQTAKSSSVSVSSKEKRVIEEDEEEESHAPRVVEYAPRRDREIIYEDDATVIRRRDYDSADVSSSGKTQTSASSDGGASDGLVLTASKTAGSERTVLASGAILISVDGLTNEAFNEILKINVIDLKGKSFLIEEGGYIKEVFPKLAENGELAIGEDGKPIYTKIIKGKKSDPKFAKAKIENRRAPAAVSSAADVKRENDNVRDRTKYSDLRELIKKAGQ